jgi:hypothetical protein
VRIGSGYNWLRIVSNRGFGIIITEHSGSYNRINELINSMEQSPSASQKISRLS